MLKNGRVIVIFLIMTAWGCPVHAEVDTGSRSRSGTVFRPMASVELEYSDNIFELDSSGRDRVESPDAVDKSSGRVQDMSSVWDLTVTSCIGVSAEMGSPFGGALGLSSRVKYHVRTQNSQSSYPEFGLMVDHSVGNAGKILFSYRLVKEYFKSNELAGVVDENGNGNISRDERIYARALYDEYEALIAYKHKLYKNKKAVVSKVIVEPFAGIGERTFGSAFGNRNRDLAFAGLGVSLDLFRRIEVGLSYRFDNIRSPDGEELVLYDETRDNADVNEDGGFDRNAALVTRIDRSSQRHVIGIEPSLALTERCILFAGYQWRKTFYRSSNVLDVNHFGQEAVRWRVKTGLAFALTPAWSADLEYAHIVDEDVENGDTTENLVFFKIRYRFR